MQKRTSFVGAYWNGKDVCGGLVVCQIKHSHTVQTLFYSFYMHSNKQTKKAWIKAQYNEQNRF